MRKVAWLLAVCWTVLAPGAGVVAFQGKPKAGGAAAAPKYDEAKLKALEAKLAKSPKDAKLKMEVAEASYQVGAGLMYNENLPPMMKYRPALKHFRRALELNPKHVKAAGDKKTIEDIYKQMGRPIPQ